MEIMLFYIPPELIDFIDFTTPEWSIKDSANEEQRKKLEKILNEMKEAEKKMIGIQSRLFRSENDV
jgi:hypothetical protein